MIKTCRVKWFLMLKICFTILGETSIKRNMERESPPKELPTKMLRYQRMKERQHTPPLGGIDDTQANSKKCAGTQT